MGGFIGARGFAGASGAGESLFVSEAGGAGEKSDVVKQEADLCGFGLAQFPSAEGIEMALREEAQAQRGFWTQVLPDLPHSDVEKLFVAQGQDLKKVHPSASQRLRPGLRGGYGQGRAASRPRLPRLPLQRHGRIVGKRDLLGCFEEGRGFRKVALDRGRKSFLIWRLGLVLDRLEEPTKGFVQAVEKGRILPECEAVPWSLPPLGDLDADRRREEIRVAAKSILGRVKKEEVRRQRNEGL